MFIVLWNPVIVSAASKQKFRCFGKSKFFNCQDKQGVRHKAEGKKLTFKTLRRWPFHKDGCAGID